MLSSESPPSSSLDEGSHMPLPCFEVLPRLTSSLGSLGLFCMSLAGMNSTPFCTQSSSKAQKWSVSSRLCQICYLQRRKKKQTTALISCVAVVFWFPPPQSGSTGSRVDPGTHTEAQTWHQTSSRTRICWQLPAATKRCQAGRCGVTFSERSRLAAAWPGFRGEHHNWQRCREDHVVCTDPEGLHEERIREPGDAAVKVMMRNMIQPRSSKSFAPAGAIISCTTISQRKSNV